MAEIPEHLLKRAQEAKARATTGGDSSPTEATASESKIPEERSFIKLRSFSGYERP